MSSHSTVVEPLADKLVASPVPESGSRNIAARVPSASLPANGAIIFDVENKSLNISENT